MKLALPFSVGSAGFLVLLAVIWYAGFHVSSVLAQTGGPAAPQGFSAVYDTSEDRLKVSWNKAPGAEGYEIRWKLADSGQWVVISTHKEVVERLVRLGRGPTAHGRYTVKARVQVNGAWSPWTNSLYVVIPAPPKPTGVAAVYDVNNQEVMVTWDEVAGADSYAVAWRRDEKTGPAYYSEIVPSGSSHRLKGLSVGVYHVKVAAVSRNAVGPYSAEQTVSLVEPPSNFSAVYRTGDNRIRVSWDEIPKAKAYEVRWSVAGGQATVVSVRGEAFERLVRPGRGQAAHGRYGVEARVRVDAGWSPWVKAPDIVIPAPPTPTGVAAVYDANSQEVVVTWDEAAGSDSYNLAWRADGDHEFVEETGITGLRHRLSDLVAGVYHVKMAAVSNNAVSPYSAEQRVVVMLPPSGFEAVYSTADDQIVVGWDNVPGATSFDIRWSLNGGPVTITSVKGRKYSYLIRPPSGQSTTAAGVYLVDMRAHLDGNTGPWTNISTIVVPGPPPPVNLTGSYDPISHDVKFVWDAVPGAEGYKVAEKAFRGIIQDISYESTPSFVFPEAWPDDYAIHVAVRISNAWSDYSSEATVTVPPRPVPPRYLWLEYINQDGYRIEWEEVPGATEYVVNQSRDGTDGPKVRAPHAGPFKVRNASDGVYSFRIQARVGGELSPPSIEETILFPPPGAPSNVSAVYVSARNAIDITWDEVPNAEKYHISINRGMGLLTYYGTRSTVETKYRLPVVSPGLHIIEVQTEVGGRLGTLSPKEYVVATLPPEDFTGFYSTNFGAAEFDWAETPGAKDYQIRWGKVGETATVEDIQGDDAFWTRYEISIDQASVDTTYQMQLRSRVLKVWSDWTKPLNIVVPAYDCRLPPHSCE